MFQIPLDHSKSIVTAGFDWSGEQILSQLPVCYRRCTPYIQSTYIVQSIMRAHLPVTGHGHLSGRTEFMEYTAKLPVNSINAALSTILEQS